MAHTFCDIKKLSGTAPKDDLRWSGAIPESGARLVMIPFSMGFKARLHAACLSFMAGVKRWLGLFEQIPVAG